jgi:hypothetical protein
LFTLEVIVKRPFGNAGRLGNVLDTARAKAALDELLHGGFENGITGGAARQRISFGGLSGPLHVGVKRGFGWN